MRAAQNPVDHLNDLAAVTVPAELGDLIEELPGWLRAVLLVLIMVRFCAPSLQGPGKVMSQLVRSSSTGLSGSHE